QKQALHPVLIEKLGNFRTKIAKKSGIILPGILFRLNEIHLSLGEYFFTINEISSVMNRVNPDQKLCKGTIEKLNPMGIKGEIQNDTLDKIPLIWVQENDWTKVKSAGMELLDPMDFVFRDLEALLIKNSVEIFGFQEAANLCRENQRKEIKEISKDPEKLRDLTEVLKTLLAEEIPLVDFEEIALSFLEYYNNGSIESIIKIIRNLPLIKAKIPGNNPKLEKFLIGSKFEKIIKNNLVKAESLTFLELYPQLAQDLLSTIRKKIPKSKPLSLVVEDESIRVHLKKLVELEFPDLYVISHSELVEPQDSFSENKVIEYS